MSANTIPTAPGDRRVAKAEDLYRALRSDGAAARPELVAELVEAITAITAGLRELGAASWLVQQLHTRATVRLLAVLGGLPQLAERAVVAPSWLETEVAAATKAGDLDRLVALTRYATAPTAPDEFQRGA